MGTIVAGAAFFPRPSGVLTPGDRLLITGSGSFTITGDSVTVAQTRLRLHYDDDGSHYDFHPTVRTPAGSGSYVPVVDFALQHEFTTTTPVLRYEIPAGATGPGFFVSMDLRLELSIICRL